MRLLLRYGTLLVLLALCVLSSILTIDRQFPSGRRAAKQVAAKIRAELPEANVLIVARNNEEDELFASSLNEELARSGQTVIHVVRGEPVDARRAITEDLESSGGQIDAIACSEAAAKWQILSNLSAISAKLHATRVIQPEPYLWPNFLKSENLINVANQIAVIAMVAIGMTFVIVAGGIDLSVGSLIALSSIVATLLIREHLGGQQAGTLALVVASVAGIVVCALVGMFSGICVVGMDIPPFIVTLAMMLVARGSAKILAKGETIYQIPESFTWLGRGADLLGIPNSVVLMMGLYLVAHVTLSETLVGRNIYAVGGNRTAAFLSGVPVKKVLLFTYITSGCLAGLGGIVVASMFKSGSPNYGLMAELDVIAAVVVGGTSLSGGRGTILGTLIGAFIIAVIRNTMNLTNVEPYTQDVILGLVILSAVTLDRVKTWFIKF
jgi:ribose transport system permease protein